jgi:hypothetical protein
MLPDSCPVTCAASGPEPIRIAASSITAKCQAKKAQESLEKFLSLFAAGFRFIWYEDAHFNEWSRQARGNPL